MVNPLKPFVVLAFTIFAVMLFSMIGPALLGPLGHLAKTSDGSDGQGFSVSNKTIDQGAHIALVDVPSLTIAGIAVWALLALLVLLAYSGVI
ncbi:hypothetical protein A4G99_03790 [Haladaptatus sp. R4]|uniref:hypothetical protein n=1 Tax=Haladaptatus sp. R4 TaxID=1679489 RepID=UPI0007B4EB61|nr:hypothetical protein [Haladaptatus sp. R4]KZN25602.1 hypothetical protein A4G99_03790 [Haladaptatus sp. R4]